MNYDIHLRTDVNRSVRLFRLNKWYKQNYDFSHRKIDELTWNSSFNVCRINELKNFHKQDHKLQHIHTEEVA